MSTGSDVMSLIEATVDGLGYDLVDVDRSSRGRLLRVFIDLRPSGGVAEGPVAGRGGKRRAAGAMISVEDCEKVSRQLTYVFTVENIDYDRLEVSSPGLDRPLNKVADFERFAGLEVSVKLRTPPGGVFGVRKNFVGIARVVEGRPALEVEGGMIELDFAAIERARLVPVVEF